MSYSFDRIALTKRAAFTIAAEEFGKVLAGQAQYHGLDIPGELRSARERIAALPEPADCRPIRSGIRVSGYGSSSMGLSADGTYSTPEGFSTHLEVHLT